MSELGRCKGWRRESQSFHGGSQCSRDAVEVVGDKPLCKAHASGQRRSDAHRENLDQQITTQRLQRTEWEARAKIAAEKLGINASLNYNTFVSRYTESVIISLADFEELAARSNIDQTQTTSDQDRHLQRWSNRRCSRTK